MTKRRPTRQTRAQATLNKLASEARHCITEAAEVACELREDKLKDRIWGCLQRAERALRDLAEVTQEAATEVALERLGGGA